MIVNVSQVGVFGIYFNIFIFKEQLVLQKKRPGLRTAIIYLKYQHTPFSTLTESKWSCRTSTFNKKK